MRPSHTAFFGGVCRSASSIILTDDSENNLCDLYGDLICPTRKTIAAHTSRKECFGWCWSCHLHQREDEERRRGAHNDGQVSLGARDRKKELHEQHPEL